mmetsp:Transcript_42430/g.122719  ORF Transcript_42430/g.122719 Transcript_42430/m.122719 type:complete len:89 (-) Transcript_42430:35-301(-)
MRKRRRASVRMQPVWYVTLADDNGPQQTEYGFWIAQELYLKTTISHSPLSLLPVGAIAILQHSLSTSLSFAGNAVQIQCTICHWDELK